MKRSSKVSKSNQAESGKHDLSLPVVKDDVRAQAEAWNKFLGLDGSSPDPRDFDKHIPPMTDAELTGAISQVAARLEIGKDDAQMASRVLARDSAQPIEELASACTDRKLARDRIELWSSYLERLKSEQLKRLRRAELTNAKSQPLKMPKYGQYKHWVWRSLCDGVLETDPQAAADRFSREMARLELSAAWKKDNRHTHGEHFSDAVRTDSDLLHSWGKLLSAVRSDYRKASSKIHS